MEKPVTTKPDAFSVSKVDPELSLHDELAQSRPKKKTYLEEFEEQR
jgi:hypothetical protein